MLLEFAKIEEITPDKCNVTEQPGNDKKKIEDWSQKFWSIKYVVGTALFSRQETHPIKYEKYESQYNNIISFLWKKN